MGWGLAKHSELGLIKVGPAELDSRRNLNSHTKEREIKEVESVIYNV